MTIIKEENFDTLMETFHDNVKSTIDLRVDYNGVVLTNTVYPFARICGTVRDHCVVEMIYSDEDMNPYELNVWDVKTNKVYSWIHPDFSAAREEFDNRNIPGTRMEFQKHSITESIEDILAKLHGIWTGTEYDTKIVMVLDLDSEVLRILREKAETDGVSIDELIAGIIQDELERVSAGGEPIVP